MILSTGRQGRQPIRDVVRLTRVRSHCSPNLMERFAILCVDATVRLRRILVVVAFATLAAVAPNACSKDLDADQQFWLINTRAAPMCGDAACGFQKVRAWQLADRCRWASHDLEQLGRDDADIPLVIFVHGSRTDTDSAVQAGYHVYQSLRRTAEGRAFRCAVWAWPSDREQLRPRPDMQRKAAYCVTQSRYLARFLAKTDRKTPICLIGHSFGSRIIAGALHELAGRTVGERSEPTSSEPSTDERPAIAVRPLRAMLLASAMDCDALASGHRFGSALAIADHIMVTQNPCDRALRWYPRLWGRRGPQAMGAVGPALNDGAEKVEVVDIRCSVGKFHDVHCHLASGAFQTRLARYALPEHAATASTAAKPGILGRFASTLLAALQKWSVAAGL